MPSVPIASKDHGSGPVTRNRASDIAVRPVMKRNLFDIEDFLPKDIDAKKAVDPAAPARGEKRRKS